MEVPSDLKEESKAKEAKGNQSWVDSSFWLHHQPLFPMKHVHGKNMLEKKNIPFILE